MSKWRNWISHRFGFGPIQQHFLWRRVPKTPWWAGDGMALLLLLGIQVVTGFVLALSYSPSTDSAYASVQYITAHQSLGWFVRGLHYWSAGLFVVVLFFHLFRQIVVGGYKEPREGTWLTGVVLFYIVLFMSYIGYLLRWDERGVYGTRVALYMLHRVPVIGEELVLLLQGGPELSTLTLTRLYALHVIFGPVLLLALVGYHMYLVVLRGTTAPTEKERDIHTVQQQKRVYERDAHSPERGETFHPETPARLSLFPAVTFVVVLVLTLTLGPAPLYPPGNLAQTSFPREEWWLAWFSGLAALLPPWAAPAFYVLFPIVVFVILVALPFVDRSPERGAWRRPVMVVLVLLTAAALIYLTSLRRRSPWTGWPRSEPPSVPAGVELTPQAERGRVLFATYGCNSCHAIAGDGAQVGPDLTNLSVRYSLDGLRRYILNPPPGVAMPAYEGRISPDDLERIVEFCHVAQTFPTGK